MPTRSGGKSRRITTGTTTLPIVIETPSSVVPTRTAGVSPADRMTVATSTPNNDSAIDRSGPARPISPDASGVASAKHSTGIVVNSPAIAAESPRSARIWSSTGATATIGPRRFNAKSSIPASSSHGIDLRTDGLTRPIRHSP